MKAFLAAMAAAILIAVVAAQVLGSGYAVTARDAYTTGGVRLTPPAA